MHRESALFLCLIISAKTAVVSRGVNLHRILAKRYKQAQVNGHSVGRYGKIENNRKRCQNSEMKTR